jgi:hypothetical protein
MTATTLNLGLILPNVPSTSQKGAIDLPVGDVKIAVNTNTQDFMGYIDPYQPMQLFAREETERSYVGTITYPTLTPELMQVVFGEYNQTSTSVKSLQRKIATVPIASPYEIVDTDLTDATVSDVHVTILATRSLAAVTTEIVTAAPAAASEVQLDEPNTKLVFDSSQAGRKVAYFIDTAYANALTNGVEATESADIIDTLGFVCGFKMPLAKRLMVNESDACSVIRNNTEWGTGGGTISFDVIPNAGKFATLFLDLN